MPISGKVVRAGPALHPRKFLRGLCCGSCPGLRRFLSGDDAVAVDVAFGYRVLDDGAELAIVSKPSTLVPVELASSSASGGPVCFWNIMWIL